AYIVENRTINTIVSYCYLKSIGDEWNAREISDLFKIDTTEDGSDAQLGQYLLDMNIAAIQEKYPDEDPASFRDLDYVYEFDADRITNEYAVYAAIKCLLYQCSEGDIVKSELYEAIEGLLNFVARQIIEVSKQYQDVTWG
ncbi:MAG: hypothetical protein P9M03_06895, partial [Candidatus Theseobacter exili]|nr:hypothetical protein [Candidatus Theseobacter exili]